MTTLLFLVLLGIMLLIGACSGRSSDEEGYQIYNRALPRTGFIVSYVATFVGAGFFIMGTAYAYRFGNGMLWYAAGLVFGIGIFAFFSRWLKTWQQDKAVYNLPDFFHLRFGEIAGKLSALIAAILLTGDLSIQLISGGKILQMLEVSSYGISVSITVVVITCYLLAGGFRAVVWTDYVLATLICVITVLISGLSLQVPQDVPSVFDNMPAGNIIGFFLFGIFGPFSISTYYQRVFASKDERTARIGTFISGAILLALLLLLVTIGWAAKRLLPDIDPDVAFVSLLNHFGGLAFTVGALALWAALLSTADTLAFAAGQILVQNILGKRLTRRMTQASIVLIMIFAAVISFLLPSIVSVGMLFLGGGMILAPIGFLQWFMKLSQLTVVLALSAGVLSLAVYVALRPIGPTVIVLTFGVTSVVLIASHLSQKIIGRSRHASS